MKYFSLFVILCLIGVTFQAQKMNIAKLKKKLGISDDMQISDKEIEDILKDPKYSLIVKSIQDDETGDKPAAAGADKSPPSKTSTETKTDNSASDAKPSTKASPSTHSGLASKSEAATHSLSAGHARPRILRDHATSKSKMASSLTTSNEHKPDEVELAIKVNKFLSFDFVTREQARYIVELLRQPFFNNYLPQKGKELVEV